MDQQKFNFECQGGEKVEQPDLTARDIKSIDEVEPSISAQPETFLTCGFKRSKCQSALSPVSQSHSFFLAETEEKAFV